MHHFLGTTLFPQTWSCGYLKCWASALVSVCVWSCCCCLFLGKKVYFLGRNCMSRISVSWEETSKPTLQMQKALSICKNSTNIWGIRNEVKDRKYFILIDSAYVCFNFLRFLFSLSRSSFLTQCIYFPLPGSTAGKTMNHGPVGYRRGFPSKLQSSQLSKFISRTQKWPPNKACTLKEWRKTTQTQGSLSFTLLFQKKLEG